MNVVHRWHPSGLRSARQRRILAQWVTVFVIVALAGLLHSWSSSIKAWDRALLPQLDHVTRQAAPPQTGRTWPPRLPRLGTGLVLGYLYDPNAPATALNQLRQLTPVLTGVAADWYSVDAAGQISGQTQAGVVRFAERHHLLNLAVVEQTDPTVLSALLANSSAEQRAMEQMLTMVESDRFAGVNLDWEGIVPADRGRFNRFVGQLGTLFHAHGYYVTLSVPAETASQPLNSWTGAYDYPVLGREADLLMIMAYDQHWSGGQPGPIASTAWVRSVLSYTISAVPHQKVVLGIPGYGYDWNGEGAVALSFVQAEGLKHQYAPSAHGNHFQYLQNGVVHSVWFENTQSFLNKVHLVSGFELRGIVLWRIGIEDPKIWDFLQ